jgi:PmbA protein
VAEAIAIVRAAGQVAAGIYSTGESFEAVLNSEGVEAFHSETKAVFSITAMAADSSGWAKASETSAGALGTAALARRAAEKARLSAGPREIPPGRYTVILEPAAVLDLVGQIVPGFSATAVADGRCFLNDRLGQALFGGNIAMIDDAAHPLQSGAPFDGEGMARKPLALVRAGTPLEVPYSRSRARAEGKTATGHGLPLPNETGEMPANVVIAGGGTSLEEMIRFTARGVLVTRVWYIREVDPYETIMTGMTRDGTFLVEGGEIAGGLKNFRFNHSIIELLKNVEALSPAARATGEETFDMVAPAMKVREFPLSELTKF